MLSRPGLRGVGWLGAQGRCDTRAPCHGGEDAGTLACGLRQAPSRPDARSPPVTGVTHQHGLSGAGGERLLS